MLKTNPLCSPLSSIGLLFFATLTSSTAIASEKLCAIYPHLKDSYWLSVNYGMVLAAQRLNVELRVLEAGGYPNVTKQQQQLQQCRQWGAQAILLGTVDSHAFYDDLQRWSGEVPVFATVNQLVLDEHQRPQLKGSVGVDWYWMGYQAGRYLATKHPAGSGVVQAALLLGPSNRGGTKPVEQGFNAAVQDSDVKGMVHLSADNDKELQRNLVQQVIETQTVDYIVGSAVAIEAAISELRSSGKSQQIGLVSTYLSHGVYRGLLRHKVEFAPTDQMVKQGRLSVEQAVQFLRSAPYKQTLSPDIQPLTPDTLEISTIEDSLSPSAYRPTFHVKAVESQP
ncbi:TMAO reductase system periplasmic protein TorT [Vibrio navarrensis]